VKPTGRIKHLDDIRDCIVEAYGDDPGFVEDLKALVVWINNRIYKTKRA